MKKISKKLQIKGSSQNQTRTDNCAYSRIKNLDNREKSAVRSLRNE